jgi:hypothetical protein
MHTGFILVIVGAFIALAGLVLSEGYNPQDGLLASLPRMKARLTEDSRRAVFLPASTLPSGEGPVVTLQRSSIEVSLRLPRHMEDFQIREVLYALEEQYPEGPDSPRYFAFREWTVEEPGVTVALRWILVSSAAIVFFGLGLIGFARATTAESRAKPK